MHQHHNHCYVIVTDEWEEALSELGNLYALYQIYHISDQ